MNEMSEFDIRITIKQDWSMKYSEITKTVTSDYNREKIAKLLIKKLKEFEKELEELEGGQE